MGLFYKKTKNHIFFNSFSYLFVLGNLIYFSSIYYSKNGYLDVILREDYIFEWATFSFLLVTGFLFFFYSLRFKNHKTYFWLFLGCMMVFLFGAFEEVSWFQRVFNFSGAEIVVKNNSQGEFNVHNLMVGGNSINKMIFGKLLGILIGLFYIVPSFTKELSLSGKLFFKGIYLPTPVMKDFVLFIITVGTVYLYLDFRKQGEILEFLLSFQMLIFFLREYFSLEEL